MIRHAAASLNLPGVAHGFFGRSGGVSTGLYDSLNCGPGSKDAPAAVTENRRLVAEALGARLVSLAQIHSAIVHALDGTSPGGMEGDAMVTRSPGLALGILTADCAPVLLAEPETGVIGAAHAGWKGALAGVLEATVAAMEAVGARRRHIVAAIGPAISQAHYEVGGEMRGRILADEAAARFFVPGARAGHYRFDLEAYAAWRLGRAGIESIERLRLCTYPEPNGFFSYRRATHRGETDYGRQVSVIALPASFC
jgi:YfiH family protein